MEKNTTVLIRFGAGDYAPLDAYYQVLFQSDNLVILGPRSSSDLTTLIEKQKRHEKETSAVNEIEAEKV